ncbi:MAG: hypothetical protein OJF50_002393 [Nitrospira sp.]|nr:hypothetical protein [Nitrospira sp.]
MPAGQLPARDIAMTGWTTQIRPGTVSLNRKDDHQAVITKRQL